jgi:hypothetical protein
VNSYVDKLFKKRKMVGWFVTVGVIVRRNHGCGTTVKVNDGGGWSSDGVILWLERRQNRDAVE